MDCHLSTRAPVSFTADASRRDLSGESEPPAPNSTYGEIKLRCEELLTKLAVGTGARSVAARLFNVTGPGNANGIVANVARQAAEICCGARADFRLRSNTPILDLVDVQEAAEGLVRLAEATAPPPIVNVCSGRMITTNNLINAACQVIGRDCPVSYEDDRGPCDALIGSPGLMAATTGWSARKPIDQIVRDVILSLQKGEETQMVVPTREKANSLASGKIAHY